MKAWTVVGPTNFRPRLRNSLESLSDAGVVDRLWGSASPLFASHRQKNADSEPGVSASLRAATLLMTASTFPRCRTSHRKQPKDSRAWQGWCASSIPTENFRGKAFQPYVVGNGKAPFVIMMGEELRRGRTPATARATSGPRTVVLMSPLSENPRLKRCAWGRFRRSRP